MVAYVMVSSLFAVSVDLNQEMLHVIKYVVEWLRK